MAQVEGDVQVMVRKGEVLLRVQDLQERRGGIAPEIAAELVDLVEHENRVVGFGPADPLDHAAGQGADVRPPVPPDLRLVADAAQGDPDEFAAQGAGDRVAQGCFAGPGRPGEAEDRAFGVRFQLAHRQVFDDPLLGLFQTVVVVVQDFPGFPDVQVVLRAFIPGEGRDPVQVGGGDGVLGR